MNEDWTKEFDGIVNQIWVEGPATKRGGKGMARTFLGHGIAMIVMLIGIVLGVILAITDSWQTGLIVGIVIVAAGAILAVINLVWFGYRTSKETSAAFADFDKKFGNDWPKF